jgi:hypothetical protein
LGSDTLDNPEEVVYFVEFGFYNPTIQFGLYSAHTEEEVVEYFTDKFGEFPEFHIRDIREADAKETAEFHRVIEEQKKELN